MKLKSEYYFLRTIFDIFLFIKGKEILITVPSYDVYSKKCIISLFKNETILFYYDKYQVLIKDVDGKLNVNVVNFVMNESVKAELIEINKETYEKSTCYIDREKILQMPYQESVKMNIHYQYLICEQLAADIRKYIKPLNDNGDLELVKDIICWVMGKVNHNGMLHCKINKNNILEWLEKISKCEIELNCRDMAFIVNTIFLSFYLKSRCIECRQYETNVNNRHFMVEVYITEEKKWIAVDSSYGILFQNEMNQFLSIRELRKYFADNKSIKLFCLGKKISSILYLKALKKEMYRFIRVYDSSMFSCVEGEKVELVPSIEEYMQEDCLMIDSEELYWSL